MRLEFWKEFLKEINKQPNSFQNCSPTKDNWIAAGSGISGVTFNFMISNYYARTEVYMSRGKKELNKFIFDEFLTKKAEIEKNYGDSLQWERLDNEKACRIKHKLNDGTISTVATEKNDFVYD